MASPNVFVDGFTRIIEQGLIPDKEWDRIKKRVGFEVEAEILRAAPQADEDPQVNWNFRRDWRKVTLKSKDSFGSDFDYWNYVVDDAFRYFERFTSGDQVSRDYVAEAIAKWEKGKSVSEYRDLGLTIWDYRSGKPVIVSRGTRLEGPRVDVGPSAEFSLFFEAWSNGKNTNQVLGRVFWNVGVIHAVGRQLEADYNGIHKIVVRPIKPDHPIAEPIPNRKTPIYTFPIISILPRHYSR